jgi:hypothetical protein
MVENIQFNIIDELNKDEDINLSQLIDNIENTFLVTDQYNNYEELDLENIKVSQMIDYQMNYTIKQLIVICDYYRILKQIKCNKCNKDEIIRILVDFENDRNNEDIVSTRKNMWFYMNEVKNDKFMKKYVLW